MVENYISLNISSLVSEKNLSQDDFGILFGLKKGVINSYIKGKASPPIRVLLQICDEFNITLDDLVRRPLSTETLKGKKKETVNEPAPTYATKYVELMEKSLADKDDIIRSLKRELEQLRPLAEKKAANFKT